MALFVSGCTLPGEGQYDGKTVTCTDTRDNSLYIKFVRSEENFSNIRIDPISRYATMYIVDVDGRKHFITTDIDAYLKCDNRQ